MFSKLVGNEQVKQTLKRFIANGRVPNSMLFSGDEGVGKRQFAIELAKAFVCKDPDSLEACGVCAACRRSDVFVFTKSEKGEDYDHVFFSEHSDIGMVIPFRRNVRVGAIRALEREANFNPYEGRARAFIIEDADKMADPAANALLKTLEEPPSTTHIFLITSRPDSLLPTIRSRCQMLRFVPVATEQIREYLVHERAFSPDEADLASRLSRGSVGRAVSINVAEFRQRREKMLGVVRSAIETGDRVTMLKTGEEMNDAKNKEHFEDNIEVLASLIHDIWTILVDGDTLHMVNTDVADELTRLANMADRQLLPAWLTSIETMRQNLAVNINRKIAADALFVSMARA